ncbi:MAG: hypothetical protein M0R03_23410 [Novosphingobium sp.]|nr:hypothetical protein [Novosphingobium sp.]
MRVSIKNKLIFFRSKQKGDEEEMKCIQNKEGMFVAFPKSSLVLPGWNGEIMRDFLPCGSVEKFSSKADRPVIKILSGEEYKFYFYTHDGMMDFFSEENEKKIKFVESQGGFAKMFAASNGGKYFAELWVVPNTQSWKFSRKTYRPYYEEE